MSKLVASTSLTPNIVAHILACSGVTGRRNYGLKFGHTLTEEEREFVQGFRKDFTPTPPLSGGPYSSLLELVPSYFPSDSLEESVRSYDLLLDGLQGGLFEEGISPQEAKALEFWSPKELREWSIDSLRPMFDEVERNISRFKDILISCHSKFYKDHWTQVKPNLMAKATQIEEAMEDLDYFHVWSELLGKDFPYQEFIVYLCEARAGSTSLMAEKIAMPSIFSIEEAKEVILHEAGIHFIGPGDYFKDAGTGRFFVNNTGKVTRMEEAAICHLKSRLYRKMNLKLEKDWHISVMNLEEELSAFSRVWETGEFSNVIEAILEACGYPCG